MTENTPFKIAAIMDHPGELKAYSSFPIFMAREARDRGFEFHYVDMHTLTFQDGDVHGYACDLKIDPNHINLRNGEKFFEMSDCQYMNLGDMDMVLMVAEPVMDISYVTFCQILEELDKKTPVYNSPRALHDHANKLFNNKVPADLMPPSIISCDVQEIRDFYESNDKNIILKPLFETHGRGVFHLHGASQNFDTIIELMEHQYPTQWSAQAYIQEIREEGEKRIFLLNGDYIASYQRYPKAQESRTSIFLGSEVRPAQLNERDWEIVERIKPIVNDEGFVFTGLDIIGPYVTEVNVKSPGGLCYANEFGNIKMEAIVMDELLRRVEARKNGQPEATSNEIPASFGTQAATANGGAF